MSLTPKELVKIRTAISQQEITAIIYRLARGLDRRDQALLASCFHEGATDDHGSVSYTHLTLPTIYSV